MLQAVLDHFILEGSYGTDNLSSVEVQGEELRNSLVHELVYPFLQLFGLERIGIVDIAEVLWREARNSSEMEYLPLGQGIAYLEVACIMQADNISCIGNVHYLFLFSKEGIGAGELEFLA